MTTLMTSKGEFVEVAPPDRCLKPRDRMVSTSKLCLEHIDHDGRHKYSALTFMRTARGGYVVK